MPSFVVVRRRKSGDPKTSASPVRTGAKIENTALVIPILGSEATRGRYEEEADRAAEQALDAHEPEPSSQTKGMAPSQAPASGQPLDSRVRAFFERRFGHDFSRVRIHTENQAGSTALSLGAQAYTVGSHIAFAPGKFEPQSREGRRLLAHELAHVAQQTCDPRSARAATIGTSLSRAPLGQVQPKLIARGSTADFASLINMVLEVQFKVVVSSTGEVTLQNTNVQGPPTPAATELLSVLQTVINDSSTTTIEFIHGLTSTRASDRNVIVGSYGLSRIDLDDVSAFGSPGGRGLNAGTALSHEILEQYRKQVHSESYPVAHAAGLAAEARAAGATITPGNMRQIDATTIEIQDIYAYPDGSREEVTIHLTNGNVTSVVRRNLP